VRRDHDLLAVGVVRVDLDAAAENDEERVRRVAFVDEDGVGRIRADTALAGDLAQEIEVEDVGR